MGFEEQEEENRKNMKLRDKVIMWLLFFVMILTLPLVLVVRLLQVLGIVDE